VYFEDTGSTLDNTIEEMDAFLESDGHGSAHSGDVRNFEVVEHVGPSIVVSYERKLDGHWTKARTRVTSFAPFCRCVEDLEGASAGSRFVVIHRPHGAKTRVDVFGDGQCASMSPEQLREFWYETLSRAHDEDVAALRKFRDRA
jgi:hypothetical protein